ncbi:MAG TPA: hydroxyacylglutathione hydrolase [Gammaproteobacteria bacterium]|nr:hydroxyacylglutathione hydrolase [Gammaproteobacteria bacterium]
MLKIAAVKALRDNYIWLIQDHQRRAAIVDPGEAEPVVAAVEEAAVIPCAILITHGHHDHVGGVEELVERFHVPVYGPAREGVAGITHPLRGGELIQPGAVDAEFNVLAVPGHTCGHLAYYGSGLLFCGDTLFTAGCGRVFTSTGQLLFRSLQEIAQLPDETLIYCAHEYTEENLRFARLVEPDNSAIQHRQNKARQLRARGLATVPSTLAEEKATNPFLRCGVATVARAAGKFAGRPLSEPEQVFLVLRHWKDRLD